MNFGNWIPHLFYDLIGRIIPGAIIVILSLIVIQQSPDSSHLFAYNWEQFKNLISTLGDKNFPTFLIVMIGTAICYFVGVILGGVNYLFESSFWLGHYSDNHSSNEQHLEIEENNANSSNNDEKDKKIRRYSLIDFIIYPPKIKLKKPYQSESIVKEALVYDCILVNLPDVGARLAKLSAERAMSRALCTGTLILFIINVLMHESQQNHYFANVILIIFMLLVFLKRIYNFYNKKADNGEKNQSPVGVFVIVLLLIPLIQYVFYSKDMAYVAFQYILFFIFAASYAFNRHISIRSKKLMENNYHMADLIFKERLKKLNNFTCHSKKK